MKLKLGKVVPFVLALGMTLALSTTVFAYEETGTENDPVLIDTAEELNEFLTDTTSGIVYGKLTDSFEYDTDNADLGIMLITSEKDLDMNDCTITIPNDVNEKDAPIEVSGDGITFSIHDGEFIAGINELKLDGSDSKQGAARVIYVTGKGSTIYVDRMKMQNAYYNQPAIMVYADSEVFITDTDILSDYGGAVVVYYGEATLTDCSITQEYISETRTYGSNAFAVAYGGTINVYGGEYTGVNVVAYTYSSGGTVNMYDGIFEAESYVFVADANSYYNSYLDGDYVAAVMNAYGGTYKGDIKSSIQGSYPCSAIINIYDGSFDSSFEVVTTSTANYTAYLAITGGTFAGTGLEQDAFEAYVVEDYNVTQTGSNTDGYVYAVSGVASVTDADGVSLQYATLAEAVEKAEAGDTVYIMEDITITSAIKVEKNITIQGATGDETISASFNTSENNGLFVVADEVSATFKNLTFYVDNFGITTEALNKSATITVDGCTFNSDGLANSAVSGDWSTGESNHYSLTFTNNEVNGPFNKPLHIIMLSGDELKVEGNTFTGTAQDSSNRSLTIIVQGEGASVSIQDNVFDTMYKAISIDRWEANAQWTCKYNVFTNCAYSLDIDSTNEFNKELSFAYNYFDGGLPTILDSASTDPITDQELLIDTIDLDVYPYYKTYFNGTLGNSVNAPAEDEEGEDEVASGTIATVTIIGEDGKEKSVACDTWTDVIGFIDDGATIELHENVAIEETVELDKTITIDGGDEDNTIKTTYDTPVFEVTKADVTITIQNCAFDASNADYLVYGEYAYSLVFENNDIEEGTASLIYMPLNGSNTLRVTTKY